MMPKEYIEREALLKKAIEEKYFVFRTEDLLNREVVFQTIYKDLFDFVNSIPTADVVEVTRCKDCEKWNEKVVYVVVILTMLRMLSYFNIHDLPIFAVTEKERKIDYEKVFSNYFVHGYVVHSIMWMW